MRFVNGQGDLPEQKPGLRFTQPPLCTNVGMKVYRMRRKKQIGLRRSDDHLLDRVDVGMAVHAVVRGQQGLTRGIVTNSLKKKEKLLV